MPFKNQDLCYRTIGGVKWLNLHDLYSDDLDAAAKAVKDARPRIRARRINQGEDGGHGIFVHPGDLERATEIFNNRLDELGA